IDNQPQISPARNRCSLEGCKENSQARSEATRLVRATRNRTPPKFFPNRELILRRMTRLVMWAEEESYEIEQVVECDFGSDFSGCVRLPGRLCECPATSASRGRERRLVCISL